MSNCCDPEELGSDPINIRWSVVRGDTSTIRVDFLDYDETTHFNTSSWQFAATVYDFRADVLDELTVTPSNGYVLITAPSDITENWGSGYGTVSAELAFDLQITVDDEIWTPILGTIVVQADVSVGGL